ncbi:MAG: BPL-N domain-containing protein [Pseudomonadota bacterium]
MKVLFFLLIIAIQVSAASGKIFLYEGKGAWDSGIENLEAFLKDQNLSFETKQPQDLILGDLALQDPTLLIMPGGESWVYLEDLGTEGAQNIRNYVAAGGSYLGICAGAFYATSHREGGAATGPYGIGLLEGTAYDGTALEAPGYIEGVMEFLWELGNPLVSGLGRKVRMLLYGGPAFRFSKEEAQKKQIEVILRFSESNDPAMIRFRYGKGRVFLSAPHVEIKKEKGEKPLHDLSWQFLRRVVNSLWH